MLKNLAKVHQQVPLPTLSRVSSSSATSLFNRKAGVKMNQVRPQNPTRTPQDFQLFVQAEVAKLIASLRINVGLKPLKVKHSYWGYRGGLDKTRESLTKLLVDERVEVSQYNGIVLRQYTERLISDAIMYGDKHKPTMEMASWWLDSVRENQANNVSRKQSITVL